MDPKINFFLNHNCLSIKELDDLERISNVYAIIIKIIPDMHCKPKIIANGKIFKHLMPYRGFDVYYRIIKKGFFTTAYKFLSNLIESANASDLECFTLKIACQNDDEIHIDWKSQFYPIFKDKKSCEYFINNFLTQMIESKNH